MRYLCLVRSDEIRLHSHPDGLRATQSSIPAARALKGLMLTGELAELLLERTTLMRGAGPLQRNGRLSMVTSGDAREHPLKLTSSGRHKLESVFPDWKAAQDIIDRQTQEDYR